jgi:hypothetical protein
MPNPSIKNERVYRALRRRGYSKESAARISNAQAKRRRHKSLDALVAYVDRADHSPAVADAYARLLPELPSYKGESLGPGITRIRGNLCNVHGRYGRCPGSGSASAERTDAKRQAREQRRSEQRAASDAARAEEDAKRSEEDAYIAGGATAKERAARRREVAEKRRERAAARREAARQARAQEAQQRAQEDEAERNERLGEEKPKGGGGGGGGKKKPSADEKRAQQAQQRAQTAARLGSTLGLGHGTVDALRTAA